MIYRLVLATVLIASVGLAGQASAQSPWESDAYKKYAPQPEGEQPTSGLEGYSLSNRRPVEKPNTAVKPVTPNSSESTSTATAAVDNPVKTKDGMSPQVKKFIGTVKDTAFMTLAMQTGTSILVTSEIAAGRSKSQDIKALAKKMESGYRPIQLDLKELVKSNKITIVKSGVNLQKDTIGKLNTAKEEDVDKLYVHSLQSNLRQLEAMFKQQAKEGQSLEIKTYAGNKIRALQKLAAQAKEIGDAQKSADSAKRQQQQPIQPQRPGVPYTPSFTGPPSR